MSLDKSIDPYGFEEECISDTESVASDEEIDISLDDWSQGINRLDSFEFRNYTLKNSVSEDIYNNNDKFANTVISGLSNLRCVSAVRLLADIHDLDNEENIRWAQKIRFEVNEFEDIGELKRVMLEHLNEQTAPVWHRLTIDETSDKGYNKIVKYHRDYFDFCIQISSKTRTQVTTICGEREIHPGNFIKTITDHNIPYSSNDCLIQCLNEIAGKRLIPSDTREQIWPGGNTMKDLHTIRHITTISKIYNVKLVLSDIIKPEKILYI